MGERSTTRRFLLRFSLRALFVFVALLLLGISHWNTSRELQATRDELAQLKRVTGDLVVRDPGKLHVRAVRTTVARKQAFLWRLHVPDDATYRVTVEVSDLRPTYVGGPTQLSIPSRGEIIVTPGEWMLWYEHQGEAGTDLWDAALTLAPTDDSDSTSRFEPLGNVPWEAPEWKKLIQALGVNQTEAYDSSEQVDLLKVFAVQSQSDLHSSFPPESLKLRVRLTPIPSQH